GAVSARGAWTHRSGAAHTRRRATCLEPVDLGRTRVDSPGRGTGKGPCAHSTGRAETVKQRPDNMLDAWSNSDPAVLLLSEGRASGPSEGRYRRRWKPRST